MKKLFLLCFPIILLTLISCNNNEVKKNTKDINSTESLKMSAEDSIIAKDFCTEIGSANFIIHPDSAQDMITNFENLYRMSGTPQELPNLLPSYWVDSCIVFALDTFFRDSTRFDGAWVIFGADTESTQKKTTIFIVPTIYDTSDGFHKNQWNINIPLLPNCSSMNYFSSYRNAKPKIDEFRNHYRQERSTKKDSLSRRVWVHNCVFKSLAAILKQHSTSDQPLDGISIESAAYKSYTLPSQINANQSTIVIVTTRNGGDNGTHIPAWDITNKYYQHLVVKNKQVYNHGELCPNACNDVDD